MVYQGTRFLGPVQPAGQRGRLARRPDPQATALGGFRETAAAPGFCWRPSLRPRAVALPSPRVPPPPSAQPRFDHVVTANHDSRQTTF